MAGKQVTELDALPSFTDNSLLPVHNGAGLKKGLLSQLANYLGNKFSNPNLLINPDFKINQRGATSYEQQGYSVDRWKIWNVTVTPNANGGITAKNDKYADIGTFIQNLENATEGDSTLSCYVESVSGTITMVADDDSQVVLKQGLNVVHTNKSTKKFTIFLNQGTSITLKWVKLEQGKVATKFIAPIPADELVKCRRYYKRLSTDRLIGVCRDNHVYTYIENIDFRKPFTIVGDVTKVVFTREYKSVAMKSIEAIANDNSKLFISFLCNPSGINDLVGSFNAYDLAIDAEIY